LGWRKSWKNFRESWGGENRGRIFEKVGVEKIVESWGGENRESIIVAAHSIDSDQADIVTDVFKNAGAVRVH